MFFGRIVCLKKTLRLCLTFSSGRSLQKTENPIMAIEVFQPKVIRSHHNKGRLVSLDPHRHILSQILSQFSTFYMYVHFFNEFWCIFKWFLMLLNFGGWSTWQWVFLNSSHSCSFQIRTVGGMSQICFKLLLMHT